jgi:hypothetical protein
MRLNPWATVPVQQPVDPTFEVYASKGRQSWMYRIHFLNKEATNDSIIVHVFRSSLAVDDAWLQCQCKYGECNLYAFLANRS